MTFPKKKYGCNKRRRNCVSGPRQTHRNTNALCSPYEAWKPVQTSHWNHKHLLLCPLAYVGPHRHLLYSEQLTVPICSFSGFPPVPPLGLERPFSWSFKGPRGMEVRAQFDLAFFFPEARGGTWSRILIGIYSSQWRGMWRQIDSRWEIRDDSLPSVVEDFLSPPSPICLWILSTYTWTNIVCWRARLPVHTGFIVIGQGHKNLRTMGHQMFETVYRTRNFNVKMSYNKR